jgi:hypothetical protein
MVITELDTLLSAADIFTGIVSDEATVYWAGLKKNSECEKNSAYLTEIVSLDSVWLAASGTVPYSCRIEI